VLIPRQALQWEVPGFSRHWIQTMRLRSALSIQRLWMFDVLVCPLCLFQPLVFGTVFHHTSLLPPLRLLLCCRLKSHLFSLSYLAFWFFSHLYSARACSDSSFWTLQSLLHFNIFSARQHICYSALYAIARPSGRLSVCLSVTRVDQSKAVEVRSTQPSPQSSPMTLVSWRIPSPWNSKGKIGSRGAE